MTSATVDCSTCERGEIVNMPANGELLSIDNFVCYTWVVGVEFETHIGEVGYKFAVEEDCTLEHAI